MTIKSDHDGNPRPQTKKLIEDLLLQRQRMLVLLWELSKLDLNVVDNAIKDVLNDFIEILVDYIACGHFGLYHRIAEGKERRTDMAPLQRLPLSDERSADGEDNTNGHEDR